MFCLFYMFPVKLSESGRVVLGVYEAPSLACDKGLTLSWIQCLLRIATYF